MAINLSPSSSPPSDEGAADQSSAAQDSASTGSQAEQSATDQSSTKPASAGGVDSARVARLEARVEFLAEVVFLQKDILRHQHEALKALTDDEHGVLVDLLQMVDNNGAEIAAHRGMIEQNALAGLGLCDAVDELSAYIDSRFEEQLTPININALDYPNAYAPFEDGEEIVPRPAGTFGTRVTESTEEVIPPLYISPSEELDTEEALRAYFTFTTIEAYRLELLTQPLADALFRLYEGETTEEDLELLPFPGTITEEIAVHAPSGSVNIDVDDEEDVAEALASLFVYYSVVRGFRTLEGDPV